MNQIRYAGPPLAVAVVMAAVVLGGPKIVRQLALADEQARRDVAFKDQESRVAEARAKLQSGPLAALNTAFRDVASSVEPSVVHLSVKRKMRASEQGNWPDSLEDLRRWFRNRGRPPQQQEDEQQDEEDDSSQDYEDFNVPEQYGSGSGWVYEDGKHIITNNHVVESADSIAVKFYDGSEREAKIVGTDRETDIAVLRVEGGAMHPSKLSMRNLDQGEIVFAFGSPFQFEFSVSQGIVSGKGRELGILREVHGYEKFIQTDAAVNPGNSGGPLTDVYGEVIGMNTAIATRTGASNGLGFAIPIDMIRHVVTAILSDDEHIVRRGYLGVWLRDLDPELARSFGYEGPGVVVDDFVDGESPAAKAGMKLDDIIVSVNDERVIDSSELRQSVARIPPGQTIKVRVFRDGQYRTLSVTLAEKPKEVARVGLRRRVPPPEQSDEPEAADMEILRQLGIEKMATMSEAAADQFGIDFVPGVAVLEVRPNSAAASRGLLPGAVITQVMGQPITSVTELAEAFGKHKDKLTDGIRIRATTNGRSSLYLLILSK